MKRSTGIKAFTAILLATAIVPNVFARPRLMVCAGVFIIDEDPVQVTNPVADDTETQETSTP